MNIIIDKNKFIKENVFFKTPVKNVIIEKGNFFRIIYSNAIFILNCIIFKLDLQIIHCEKYFNKYKYYFNCDCDNTKIVIDRLSYIEREILDRISIKDKSPVYRINQHLLYGNIKIQSEPSTYFTEQQVFLKISGIWETDTEYGLSFKFFDIDELLQN